MDQSFIIAAHYTASNTIPIQTSHSEDEFYDRFGKDYLAGLKFKLSRFCGFAKTVKSNLRAPATTIAREA